MGYKNFLGGKPNNLRFKPFVKSAKMVDAVAELQTKYHTDPTFPASLSKYTAGLDFFSGRPNVLLFAFVSETFIAIDRRARRLRLINFFNFENSLAFFKFIRLTILNCGVFFSRFAGLRGFFALSSTEAILRSLSTHFIYNVFLFVHYTCQVSYFYRSNAYKTLFVFKKQQQLLPKSKFNFNLNIKSAFCIRAPNLIFLLFNNFFNQVSFIRLKTLNVVNKAMPHLLRNILSFFNAFSGNAFYNNKFNLFFREFGNFSYIRRLVVWVNFIRNRVKLKVRRFRKRRAFNRFHFGNLRKLRGLVYSRVPRSTFFRVPLKAMLTVTQNICSYH